MTRIGVHTASRRPDSRPLRYGWTILLPREVRTLMRNDVGRAKKDARPLYFDGESWLVYELSALYDRRGPSLVFESETVVRRVRDYPAEWREFTDAELARVMEGS